MARINTNISSLIARNNLARTNTDLGVRLQRLSTGLRINRGADDPAGLIVSERLRTELSGLDQAISNSERASSVIATTEGYLAEVATCSTPSRGWSSRRPTPAALSQEEIEANQLQIDSAIESITRISNTASFAGLQLLNGSLEYLTSGVPTSAICGRRSVQRRVRKQHEPSGLGRGHQLGADGVALPLRQHRGVSGALLSSVTIEIAGTLGVQTLSFVSGTALSGVVAAVNTLRGFDRRQRIAGQCRRPDQRPDVQLGRIRERRVRLGPQDRPGWRLLRRLRPAGRQRDAAGRGSRRHRDRQRRPGHGTGARRLAEDADPGPGARPQRGIRPDDRRVPRTSTSPAAEPPSRSAPRSIQRSRWASASARSRPADSAERASGRMNGSSSTRS